LARVAGGRCAGRRTGGCESGDWALSIPTIYLLAMELSDRRHARLCALFAFLSPFFLFMSSNFLSHASCMLFTALSALLMLRALRLNSWWLYLGSGLAAGAALLVRPPDAGAVWLFLCLFALYRTGSKGIPRLALANVGILAGVFVYLWYNRLLMGEWFTPPHVLTGGWNRFGFASDIGAPEWEDNFPVPGHTPWRSLLNLNFNMAVLGTDLFGWPISSLSFAILFVCFGRKSWAHWFAIWMICGITLLYAGLWYHGICFGARYYYSAVPYYVFLTVSGILALPGMLEEHFARPIPGAWRFVRSLVVLLFVFSGVFYLPFVSFVTPYHRFCDFHDGAAQKAKREGLKNAIVFVSPPGELALPALAANRVPPEAGEVIFANDLGEEHNRVLIGKFPDRSVHYIKTHPRISNLKEFLEKIYLRKLAPDTTTSVEYLDADELDED
jgi:4-amino-4-deoxy-L-arabinose transferase-like glycosyltransferase